MTQLSKQILFITLLAAVLLSACKTMNKTQKGAIIGTTGGAAMGAVVGKATGKPVLGAIIGGTVGGTVGVIIGRNMDKQAEEIAKEVPGAKVERVGEGIIMEFNEKILFDYAKYDLKSGSKRSLDNFVDVLKKYPDTNIEIQGHTDSKGSESYNQKLSKQRADAALNYLSSNSISESRLTARGMGESYAKVDNDSDANRSENRRVEFLIFANEKMKSDAQKEAGNNK